MSIKKGAWVVRAKTPHTAITMAKVVKAPYRGLMTIHYPISNQTVRVLAKNYKPA